MDTNSYGLSELAEAAGVSGRTVRYYVQEGLLPAPAGLGRGSHYDDEHLARLRRITQWQRAGHSLLAIRRMLEGKPPGEEPQRPGKRATRERPVLMARVELIDGVELSFDARRFTPTDEDFKILREAARRAFGL
jgi:DNA-binding transcriptional MerR regulator